MRAHEFVTEGREEFNWELMQPGFEFEQEIAGVTYKVTNDSGQLMVTAWDPKGKQIGHAVFWKHQTRSGLESLSTEVDPAWQGKGVATNMYAVVRMLGANINPSLFQTRQGKHMWNKWRQQGDVAQLKNMNAKIKEQGVAENFADGKVKGCPGMAAALTETFDQPYPMTWEHGEESHDALVKLPDGTNLSIMFSMDYGAYGDEEWTVEFWRNNSQEATGEGDQQRVFATVLSAIQQFIKTEHPERIRFSANKDVEQGQKSQTRSNLYTKLVQRYANSWGYGVDVDDFVDTTVYNLHTLNENFADGKVKGKSRPGRVKRAGASCSGSVTDLRQKAKNASGEKAKMYHWCANMKSGRKK